MDELCLAASNAAILATIQDDDYYLKNLSLYGEVAGHYGQRLIRKYGRSPGLIKSGKQDDENRITLM